MAVLIVLNGAVSLHASIWWLALIVTFLGAAIYNHALSRQSEITV